MCNFILTAINQNQSTHIQSSPGAPKSTSQRGTGIDETELPAKYFRKPLSQLEIETIEVSGM